jgi:MFS superfamily sulfate permease-like transporter
MVNFVSPGAVIIGIVSIIILIIAEKPFYKKDKILSSIPGPLLVVVFGVLLTSAFKGYSALMIDKQHLVSLPVIASFSDLKSNLFSPNFNFINTSVFWILAATLAVVASIETLLGIEAIDKLDPEKNESNSNKELIAQGVGNIFCGLIGGLPVTSVIVRSSANVNSGAKSKLSVIIHALLLLISVLLFPQILALIPNACLAAILIMTGLKLTKLSIIKELLRAGYEQYLPFLVTVVVMLFTDLLKGVCAGLVVAIVFIIKDNITTSFDSTNEFIDGKMYYIIKLPQHLTFFNKGFLINYFKAVQKDSMITIDCSINKKLNADAKDVINDFVIASKKKNIRVELIKYYK